MFNVPEQPQEEANFPLSWYKHIHCHYLWRDDITQGERQYLYIRLLISHTHTHTHTQKPWRKKTAKRSLLFWAKAWKHNISVKP